MAQKRATIQDVANKAGVSITTVSRFLNEHYESMSEETKERIRLVVRELNYQPNALAQGLKGNRTRMIAVIVVNIGYPFCVSLIRALSNVLTPAGYNLVVCETGGDKEREAKVLQSMVSQRIDGVVIQTNGDNNHELERMAKSMPIVLVDRRFPVEGSVNVLTNNYEASLQMSEHLIRQGYESTLYITESADQIHTRQERLDGYMKACSNHGQTPRVALVRRGDRTTFETAARLIADGAARGTTAVYTANALLLQELYPYLMGLHLEVPLQLGISTFDEPDWITLVSPSLTYVRQPVSKMGQWIGQMLINSLKEPRQHGVTQERVQTFPSELVLGQSTIISRKDSGTR